MAWVRQGRAGGGGRVWDWLDERGRVMREVWTGETGTHTTEWGKNCENSLTIVNIIITDNQHYCETWSPVLWPMLLMEEYNYIDFMLELCYLVHTLHTVFINLKLKHIVLHQQTREWLDAGPRITLPCTLLAVVSWAAVPGAESIKWSCSLTWDLLLNTFKGLDNITPEVLVNCL